MTYWYLASPYTKYPRGLAAAFDLACENAGILMLAGVPVFSPIAHSHPIAMRGALPVADHGFWMRADRPMMEAAHGMIFLLAESWTQSRGMAHELDVFGRACKPVLYMEPGIIPAALTQSRA